MSTLTLQRPVAGQTLITNAQIEDSLIFDFNIEEATLIRNGQALTITFTDGATITLEGFYTGLPALPVEGQNIDSEEFFAQLGEKIISTTTPDTSTNNNANGDTNANASPDVNANTDASTADNATTSTDTSTENGNASTSAAKGGGGVVQAVNSLSLQEDSSFDSFEQISSAPAVSPVVNTQNAPTVTMPVTSAAATTPSPAPEAGNPSPAPEAGVTDQFFTQGDVLAADQGSRISGNILENDTLPEGVSIKNIIAPDGWLACDNEDGSITYTYEHDARSTFTIHANGDYVLTTNIENLSLSNVIFGYEVIDEAGNTYAGDVSIGTAESSILNVETLEGNSALVTTGNGNSYLHEFTSYASDSEIGNQHVNGMLLGAGDDIINVENAIGSQTNPQFAGANDTFIYGDSLRNEDANAVGNDEINVTNLDGTKIRADGNLYAGVVGGDDTVNVEIMEGGSIIGDGWHLYAGSSAGNDLINVGTMNNGEIYGDGVSINGAVQGGNDSINIDTIDTTISGRQDVIIDGGVGDDIISVNNLNTVGGDIIKINGGAGNDTFNYDSNADDTMALLGSNIYISGDVSQITNFEGVSTGAGNDLIKLYDRVNNELNFENIFVDAGEDMDVVMANLSNFDEISAMIENDQIENTEVLVLSNDLNNANTKSVDDLLGKLEGEGVDKHDDGSISFDDSWTQGESIGEYESYTNQDQDITILVAKAQIENTFI